MEGKVNFAWAIEADHAQLGARLEAWIETKAAISTLTACFKHYRLPAKGGLPARGIPEEIQTMIANELKTAVYEERVQRWTRVQRCVELNCETLDHFTPRDLEWHCVCIAKEPRCVIDNTLARETSEIHGMRIRRHLQEIIPCAEEKGRIVRYMEVSSVKTAMYSGL